MIFPPGGHPPYAVMRWFNRGLVARFERSLAEPEAAQRARLAAILAGAEGSAFARDHGLAPGMSLEQYRAAVPSRAHAALKPWLDRVEAAEPEVLTRFAVTQMVQTSGTSGVPKRLPVTASWAESVGAAQRLWVLGLLRDDEQLASGAALSIVSPAVTTTTTGGLPVGSNTGRMFLAQPWWVRWRAPVPYEVYGIEDVSTRQYAILRHALSADVRSWTAANPSSILLYMRRLREDWAELQRDLADGTLSRLGQRGLARRRLGEEPALPWNLRRVNTWKGGPAAFFVARLPAALGRDVPIREAGITASEGFFATPVDDGDPVAFLDGHLLEFVGDDGEPRWAWELELGGEYRLVVSTEAGLYRYDLGDIVRVTGFAGRAPRLVFVRRAGNELSAVGERVTETQLLAVAASLELSALSASLAWAEVPWLRVAYAATDDVTPESFDQRLRAENLEYDDRRATGRLGLPALSRTGESAFAAWRARRVAEGAPEAQVKDPVILSPERWDELISLGGA